MLDAVEAAALGQCELLRIGQVLGQHAVLTRLEEFCRFRPAVQGPTCLQQSGTGYYSSGSLQKIATLGGHLVHGHSSCSLEVRADQPSLATATDAFFDQPSFYCRLRNPASTSQPIQRRNCNAEAVLPCLWNLGFSSGHFLELAVTEYTFTPKGRGIVGGNRRRTDPKDGPTT